MIMEKIVRVMQGNEACAEGALKAGLGFFAGYPITPSSEIAEILSEKLPVNGGKFIQMEDEISAMGAVIGASLTGVKAMTATSGPGFSLKQENIGFACMAEIPCVIVNVQRGGPSTGTPTMPSQGDVMQARWGSHGDHPIITVVPNGVKETFYLTIKAFNLSEKYRNPVILLMDEIIGHVYEKVELTGLDEIRVINRKKPEVPPEKYLPYDASDSDIPPMANFGEGYRYHVTGLVHDETGFPTNNPEKIDKLIRRINSKITDNVDDITEVEEIYLDDAKIGIFSYGSTSRSAKRAVSTARENGIKVGLLRPKVIWPFPTRQVQELAGSVKCIIVPELNLGQIAHEVEWAVRDKVEIIKINRVDGEPIRPQEILDVIKRVA
ncbi:2-oxoacid:acceptor oxidoreductase subunit alpha [candidate division KSB1 bacterium]|nr:MAG: 2-oxoacid:acceptor oxidoreductase subunit alpha [candidate division KSB1 bacterium]